MRVERSTLDQVQKRFELNKRKLEEKKKDYDLEQRVKELREEVRFYYTIDIVFVFIFDVHLTKLSYTG